MGIAETFSNPVVLIGGGIVGVILLLSKNGSGNANNSPQANPAVISATVSMNSAAMGAQIKLAEISAQSGIAALSYNVQEQVAVLSYLKAQDDNNRIINQARIVSNAGITNNLISSGTALAIDGQQNTNRLGLAYIAAETARVQERSKVEIARYQLDAAKAVSKNNLFASIANAVGNVAKAALI